MKSCARASSASPLARLFSVAIWMCLAAAGLAADPKAAPVPFPSAALAHAADYTFGYYPNGFRGRDAEGNIVFAVETSNYAMVVNASKARVERLGPIEKAVSAEDGVGRERGFLDSLPPTTLEFSVEVGGERYTAAEAAPKPDSVVLQRMGRFLQHFEINGVVLRNADGKQLEGATAKLVFYCWPDQLSASLELTLDRPLGDVFLRARITPSGGTEDDRASAQVVPTSGEAKGMSASTPGGIFVAEPPVCITDADSVDAVEFGEFDWWPDYEQVIFGTALKGGLAHIVLGSTKQSSDTPDGVYDIRSARLGMEPGVSRSVTATVRPFRANAAGPSRVATEGESPMKIVASAEGISPYTGPLAVSDDPVAGWTKIVLGANGDIQKNERVRVKIVNPSDKPQAARLNFAKDGGHFGIIGMSPVLRDLNGLPLGVPVQISKNWHCRPAWFSGLTELEVAPGATLEFEFTLAYANWGGVPAVSHAQLCLDGYGGNQQWDEMAIGSFGESICYDPDVNLTRSMVDDVRPLMVWGMGKTEKIQWSWTHNVGGADFLNLFTRAKPEPGKPGEPSADAKLTKQYLTSQKTLYASQGPVLADVTYAGEALGGAIRSRIRARSWRADDYVRALYTIRYDVTRPAADIARLAFFQMGADRYNENLFKKITRGDQNGEKETWTPETGGEKYSRRGVALEGETPWFALYEASKPPNIAAEDKGAWANRGLIIRSWKARLGGKDCPAPFYSIYGNGAGAAASALVELSPPPGLEALEPGDFVEAEVEMVILPQRAEDYYGPNELFRAALAANPDHWSLVHREAAGGLVKLDCPVGTIEETWPIRVRAKDGRAAQFSVAGRGGVGYTPVTISGAARPGPFDLFAIGAEGERRIDQSDMGNDWWQADYDPAKKEWSLTFTLPLDELRWAKEKLGLEWRLRD